MIGPVVGSSAARVDAHAKATGSHVYPSDVVRDDMLWVQVARSNVPHARVRAVDTAEAWAVPGVACVLTAADVPGTNCFGLITCDQPVLCSERVRYEGDAVAIVAAETDEIARRARDLIVVDYEMLPLVTDPGRALGRDAPSLHPRGNLCAEVKLGIGDIAAGFAAADVIVESEYETGRQEHAFLEPEAGAAYYDEEEVLTICVGGQNPFIDRTQVAEALGLDEDRVRVLNLMAGGSFGGKADISVQIHLGLVTYHTRRPCRLRLDRDESIRAGTKRHPFRVRYKTGVTTAGALTACEVDILADAGAYTTLSPAVLGWAAKHCCGPYHFPHTHITARAAFTNNGNASAFRGFGNPQVVFGIEQHMDRMAAAIGLDPLDFRRRNAIRVGQTSGAGFTVSRDVTLPAVLRSVEHSGLWQDSERSKRTTTRWKRRGLGLAVAWQAFGRAVGVERGARTRIELRPEGRYLAYVSAPDLGGGSLTACLQLAAGELRCRIEDFDVVSGDTHGPDAYSSNASSTVFIVGSSLMDAAARLREALLAAARRRRPGDEPRLDGDRIRFGGQEMSLAEFGPLVADGFYRPEPDGSLASGAPHAYACAAELALVEVDTLTGEIDVLRLEDHLDVGRAINPDGVKAQSEGGMIQGLGYALYEDVLMEAGRARNATLSTYMIPSILDVPVDLGTVLLENPEPLSPHGGRGVGEIALSPTAAAIANALADAIDVRFDRLPVTPERVVAALMEHGP